MTKEDTEKQIETKHDAGEKGASGSRVLAPRPTGVDERWS